MDPNNDFFSQEPDRVKERRTNLFTKANEVNEGLAGIFLQRIAGMGADERIPNCDSAVRTRQTARTFTVASRRFIT
jgi:hypothetical protein